VLLEDGDRYVLRHEEAQDVWTIAGYRASKDAGRDGRAMCRKASGC
jgi:hypothetical protein